MERMQFFAKVVILITALLVFTSLFRSEMYTHLIFSFKYLSYLIVTIASVVFLKSKMVSKHFRIFSLVFLFFMFGVLIGIHPSPICALTKAITQYQLMGFIPPPMVIMAGAMILFTILANKVFCGWVCPLGCLQEVIFTLSAPVKKINVPFLITNSIRISLLAVFLIVLFSFRINIYNYFNPFELFHWHPDGYILMVTAIVILLSLFLFRPFCQFFCPAGIITWIFEPVSLFKIRSTSDKKCTHCLKCINESPCNAINSIIESKKVIPDCFACGKCIESCPENALFFSLLRQ